MDLQLLKHLEADLMDQQSILHSECRAPTRGILSSINARLASVKRDIDVLEKNGGGAKRRAAASTVFLPTPSRRIVASPSAVFTAAFVDLPTAVVVEALGFLPPSDIISGAASSSSGLHRAATREPGLWKKLLRRAVREGCGNLPLELRGVEMRVLSRLGEVAGSSKPPMEYFFAQLHAFPAILAGAAHRADKRRRERTKSDDGLDVEEESPSSESDVDGYGGRGFGYAEAALQNDVFDTLAVPGFSPASSSPSASYPPASSLTHQGARCILALDRRCYDATPFLQDHPGGRSNLVRYSGRDATRVFDIYGHSEWAHHFMRRHLLIFDAVAFVGRVGKPFCTTPRYRRWQAGVRGFRSESERRGSSVGGLLMAVGWLVAGGGRPHLMPWDEPWHLTDTPTAVPSKPTGAVSRSILAAAVLAVALVWGMGR